MKFPLKERTVDIDGQPLAMREIGAADVLRLAKRFTGNGQTVNQDEWNTAIIAKSIVDADGKRCFDTDEGRAEIEQWPLRVWQKAADAALSLNGFDDETKKN